MYPSKETNEIEISENFYYELNALTIDPKIELKKLQYLSIVSGNGMHTICRFIRIYTRGNQYFAEVQQMVPAVADKSILILMQNELAARLKDNGIPFKR